MSLTTPEIAQIVAEISPAVRGGWIQKIQQPGDFLLVLEIRVPGQTHRLLVSCRPGTARLHLVTHPPQNPPRPPAFCQFLRAHIQGARVDAIGQHPDDRIVEMHLTAKEGPRRLVCELTGKRATILLVDAAGRILRDIGQHRELVGQPYTAPPRLDRSVETRPVSRFAGWPGSPFPLSAEIEASYREREAVQEQDAVKTAQLQSLRKAIKKEQRRIEAWRDDVARAQKYRDYARYGELIKANLASMTKGSDHLTVVDYFDEALPNVTIPLDRMKSAQGNMDDYFRKHRKYQAAERELRPRIEQAERRLEHLRQELAAIEQGTWTPPSPSPRHRPLTEAARSRAAGRSRPSGPFKRFTSIDGLPIYVGRNAKENEALTFGLAKSDDLWLHARGTPGSHVVVRLKKGTDPPPETLRDAATLALLYSDLKRSGKGDVIYTRRKWVKKAKGQAPGAVTVVQERSLYVTLDKRRLDALKERSEPAEGTAGNHLSLA